MEPVLTAAILILTGVSAGFASGLMGVGGCFLMVPVQYWLLSAGGLDGTLATRIAFGTGLAVTLPTMVSGTLGHQRRGMVDWHAAAPMGAAAVAGALLGGTFAAVLPGDVLRMFFSTVVLLMAARLFWQPKECEDCRFIRSIPLFLAIGAGVGLVSGLAGLGGGVILVPVLILLLGYPVHRAVGTSAACLIFSSAGAVAAYLYNGLGVPGLPPFTVGYVNVFHWAVLTATTVPLSLIGVRCAHLCTGRTLRIIFATLIAGIGLLMLIPR